MERLKDFCNRVNMSVLFDTIFNILLIVIVVIFFIKSCLILLQEHKEKTDVEESMYWHLVLSEEILDDKIDTLKQFNNLMFDENIVGIRKKEFKNFQTLHNIEFYGSVYIEEKAFCQCKKLQSIRFYKVPRSIASDAFLGCNSLSKVFFYGSKSEWIRLNIELPPNCSVIFMSQLFKDNYTVSLSGHISIKY